MINILGSRQNQLMKYVLSFGIEQEGNFGRFGLKTLEIDSKQFKMSL